MNSLRKSSTGAAHQTTWPLSNFQLSMINTRPSLIHFQVNFSLVFQTTFTEKSRKMLTQKILKQIDQSHQLKEIHLLQRKKKTQKVWLWSLIWKKLTDYTITLEQLKMIVILFHRAQWDLMKSMKFKETKLLVVSLSRNALIWSTIVISETSKMRLNCKTLKLTMLFSREIS